MTRKLLIALSVALVSARMAGSVPSPAIDTLEGLADNSDLNGIRLFATEHDDVLSVDANLAAALVAINRDGTYSFSDMSYQVVRNYGRGKGWGHGRKKGRGYVPWGQRPGKGRKPPRSGHPHIY